MAAVLPIKPALRDPAWAHRVFWVLAAAVVLWPMLVLAEFKPWLLLAPGSLEPTLRFLAGFVPPRTDWEFLALVARETWRTVAIATAGLTLALVLALPLALLSVRTLSISGLVADVQTLYFPIVLTAGVVFVILASKQSNAATHDALDRVGYMLIGVASGLVVGGGVRRRSQRPVTPDGEGSK